MRLRGRVDRHEARRQRVHLPAVRRAKIAFDVNREQLADTTADVSGLGKKAFYQPTGNAGGVVWVLKGDVLLTVQGVFFALGDTPPVDPAELLEELVAATKIARKKA